MSKKMKIILPCIYLFIVIALVVCSIVLIDSAKSYNSDEEYDYTIDSLFDDDTQSVMKDESDSIIRPYISDEVKISRYFYDYENTNYQENAIIYYENTYMQNSGVDYTNKDDFEIVSILDGEIESIEESSIYGNIITIKHNNNLKSVYSNVSNVLVSVGSKVSQGEIIALSKENNIDNDETYLLHFEIYNKGIAIDPESFYTLKVSELE